MILPLFDYYVDRGDVSVEDFNEGNITVDSAFHDVDMSAIVPAGAAFVLMGLDLHSVTPGAAVFLQKPGYTGGFNAPGIRIQVNGINMDGSVIVACSTDRKIQIFVTTGSSVSVTVRGWILN